MQGNLFAMTLYINIIILTNSTVNFDYYIQMLRKSKKKTIVQPPKGIPHILTYFHCIHRLPSNGKINGQSGAKVQAVSLMSLLKNSQNKNQTLQVG